MISEILSREPNKSMALDTYEYFLRQSNWKIDDRFCDEVRAFLLCVAFDGEVGNGGVSPFFYNSFGDFFQEVAEAFHMIGAFETEKILRSSFSCFPNGIPQKSQEERAEYMDSLSENTFNEYDIGIYKCSTYEACLNFLIKNKEKFLSQ